MEPVPRLDDQRSFGRRLGYAFSVGINLVLVWVVYNILEWGWPPFITEDWSRVRSILAISLVATMLVNLAFIAYDSPWFRGLGEAGAASVSLIATMRVFSVFPFDFSAYGGPWELLMRAVLVIAIVGTVIGIVANIGKAIRAL